MSKVDLLAELDILQASPTSRQSLRVRLRGLLEQAKAHGVLEREPELSELSGHPNHVWTDLVEEEDGTFAVYAGKSENGKFPYVLGYFDCPVECIKAHNHLMKYLQENKSEL